MSRDETLQGYLDQAQEWELDRAARAKRSEKTAWIVASVAILIALTSVIALAGLTPLKQPVPVVIRVENSTGIVDVVPAYEGGANLDQTISRHLLHSHVSARERFILGMAEVDYELVASQNVAALNHDWFAQWDRNNPESPLNRYKDGTTVEAQIKSISFLELGSQRQNVVQVRFTRNERQGGTGPVHRTHWIATLEFTYVKPSEDEKLRALNPLGFKVLAYHREPEIVTENAEHTGER